MLPSLKLRVCLYSVAVACLVPTPSAQIDELRIYHGKRVDCIRSGLGGPLVGTNCGTEGYVGVFTGTVKSVVDKGDTDKQLELIPEEVFVGDNSEVTATVNQACLPEKEPEIKAGDRWLFYILTKRYRNREAGTIRNEGLEVPFYSPSKPVTEADDDIARLRHLGKLTDSGILSGKVIRIGATYDNLNPTAVPNHKVVAKCQPSGAEYTAFTNVNGRFEFELPPGWYDVTAATEHGLREAEPLIPDTVKMELGLKGSVDVMRRGCRDVDFTLLTDGRIAGRVKTADGKSARFAKVAIIPTFPIHPQFTVDADENGYFEVSGRQPGQYLVGVGLLSPFDSVEWHSRVYYPGVRTREEAKIITLGDGEWRTDIDFSLLPTSK